MESKIKFLDLKSEYNLIKKEIKKVIEEKLEDAYFIGGKEVESFEKEFAKFCNVKNALSVNSGTDALFLSLKALGIKEGDEVITTPFTFIATAEVIVNCNAKPVFIDINPETFNIDTSKIAKVITKKTKAIIPVHLFGQLSDMKEISKIAKKYNLSIIEDSAQSIGSKLKMASGKWQTAGEIGDCGCFSFFPSKNLGAMGDGGMITTNNNRLAEKIRLLKNHGSSKKDKYKNLIIGTNSRLDSIQASILKIKLKYLDKWNKKRQDVAQHYNNGLKEIKDIILPIIKEDRTHIFHQYTIRAKNRDKLKKYLEINKIPTMIYYPTPLHLQPALKYLGYKKGIFPIAEKISKEVLSLPIYPELSKEDQNLIIKKIKDFYNQK